MMQVAEREGWNCGADQIDFTPWHDYQRWLAAGERRVHVNFSTELVDLIDPKAVRLRRDVGQLIRAIKVHALLHREHRERGRKTGAIMATFADYKAVRELMVDTMSESAEIKARKTLPETVDAVKRACRESRRQSLGATVNEVAAILDIDRSTTQRRLDHAIQAGYVALQDATDRRSFLYVTTGTTIGADATLLPTVEAVEEAYWRQMEEEQ